MSETIKIDTVEQLATAIVEWEHDAGECFTDYFMHDRVADNSWAFWLIGKGFSERGNQIVEQLLSHIEFKEFCCICQQTLYFPHYHPNVVKNEYDGKSPLDYDACWEDEFTTAENYQKDVLLWAEFLLATPYYTKKVTEWFNDQNK